jgi:hypothetical protein
MVRLRHGGRHPLKEVFDMARFDITKTNEAVRRLLEVTTDPRHRFLLAAYDRHRNLEMAGRYKEIFVPEMTVEHPVYHFNAFGSVPRALLASSSRAWS